MIETRNETMLVLGEQGTWGSVQYGQVKTAEQRRRTRTGEVN